MSRAKDSRRRTRSETLRPGVNASDVDPFHGWRWLWAIALAVIVPAGQRQVRLAFSSTYSGTGAVVSLIAVLLMIAVAIRKPQPPLASKPRIESGPTAGQRTLVGER